MATTDRAGQKDFWDILKIVAVAVSAVAIPVILAVVGNSLNVSLKDKDVRLRTVELAIGILREDPKNANRETKALRLWAMDVIDNYSGVHLSSDARNELQKEPIVSSGISRLSCLDGRVTLAVPVSTIVAITQDNQRGTCHFSLDGVASGDGRTISCQNFSASASFPPSYVGSTVESKEGCGITVSSAEIR